MIQTANERHSEHEFVVAPSKAARALGVVLLVVALVWALLVAAAATELGYDPGAPFKVAVFVAAFSITCAGSFYLFKLSSGARLLVHCDRGSFEFQDAHTASPRTFNIDDIAHTETLLHPDELGEVVKSANMVKGVRLVGRNGEELAALSKDAVHFRKLIGFLVRSGVEDRPTVDEAHFNNACYSILIALARVLKRRQ